MGSMEKVTAWQTISQKHHNFLIHRLPVSIFLMVDPQDGKEGKERRNHLVGSPGTRQKESLKKI